MVRRGDVRDLVGRLGRWWALAYNPSEARTRFGLDNSRPLALYLCDPADGGVPSSRFERVLARVDGRILWYGGPDVHGDPTHAAWLREAAAAEELPERLRPGLADSEKLALVYDRLRSLDEADRAARLRASRAEAWTERERRAWPRRMAERRGLEDRFRQALAKADATLRGFTGIPSADDSPGRVLADWCRGEATYRYRSNLAEDTPVIASGICLSGRDGDFDLTS